MALSTTWNRVAAYSGVYSDPVSAGICNIGGRLVMVAGSTAGARIGDVYYSDNHGLTWTKGSGLALFTSLGVGSSTPTDLAAGVLCYKPGIWIHAEDGNGFLSDGTGTSGDLGGILRAHQGGDVGAGVPIYNFQGFTQFGQPCLTRRKDLADNKFAIWPGLFLFDAFGVVATGPPLVELTQGGATSLTTAFLLHQLDPAGGFYPAGINPDGSVRWIWVTTPARIGGATAITPEAAAAAGFQLLTLASHDGVIWRPHGPSSAGLVCRNPGIGYNWFTQAFFCSDGTLLCGVSVSGLSPCIFRSTDRGVTQQEIVLPGNFFNFVPQGASGQFIFSGLVQTTYCFCELDDGTILCGGGAPTAVADPLNTGGELAYHYPAVWRSTDKGLTWENISLNVGDFATLPPVEPGIWESRILLSLGGQSALLIAHIDDDYPHSDWTPFFITEDGGNSFQKSVPPRVGLMTGAGGVITRQLLHPIQATFANDGSILVVMTDWDETVEIWRGTYGSAAQEHRAVGFVEQADIAGATFSNASIPEQELIRG